LSRAAPFRTVKPRRFLPLIDLLRAYFQIEARDDTRKVREKVTGKLLSLDRALEPSLPALHWLLDVPVEDPHWQQLDPPQRRQQTLDSIKRLLLRESQVQPLLILFEDLHWVDEETQALLDSLVGSLPAARLLLLVNYRPEYQHAWAGKSYYHQLRIEPLPPESAHELLEALLGADPGLVVLKQLLIERTEGNPFFLEESVRTLVETKALVGERGGYHLEKATRSLQIPATAQAILAARIDRLSPEDKRLLQAASVIGKDVPFTLLRAIAEAPAEALPRGLSHLQAAEFLYEARLFPDLEYTFKHALIHEVAYGSLLQERRCALHGAIVAAIERLHAGRLDEHVEPLALHSLRGELWEKAFGYLQQAGAKAMGRSAYPEAANYIEQALDASRHLPNDRRLVEQVMDLRFDLRGALVTLGQFQRALDHLDEARALAEAQDDQRRLGRIAAYMATALRSMGNHARAIESGLQALGIGRTIDDFALQVAANYFLGEVYSTVGAYPQAIQHLAWTVEHIQGDLLHERFGLAGLPAVLARAWSTRALAELGEFEEGQVRGAEGLRIAEAAKQPLSLVVACWALGYLHLQQGKIEAAIPLLERGVHIAERRGITDWLNTVNPTLGYAYAVTGRLDEAIVLLEKGHHRLVNTRGVHALFAGRLSEVYLWTGRVDEALKLASDALDAARGRGERGYEALARRVLGEIAALGPDVYIATHHYGEALALADALGMRPLVAHCHLGLGKLYRRTGKREQAQEHLATATMMYREMGMTYWLEKVEAEMKERA